MLGRLGWVRRLARRYWRRRGLRGATYGEVFVRRYRRSGLTDVYFTTYRRWWGTDEDVMAARARLLVALRRYYRKRGLTCAVVSPVTPVPDEEA